LEVKRIEQQLVGMNITGASCNTEVEIQPSDVQISRSTRFSTPNKLSSGYAALAGRVSQLVKQIVSMLSCPSECNVRGSSKASLLSH
jgi:hypothetical protein